MLGLGLTRLLPRPLRGPLVRLGRAGTILLIEVRIRLARRAKAQRDANRPDEGPDAHRGAVAILGLFSTHTGLGQGARLLAASLERQGRQVVRVDVTRQVTTRRDLEPDGLSEVPREPPCRTVVICLNPPEFLHAYLGLPLHVRRSARIIGSFAWELETLPPGWLRSLPFTDEIWASSRFVADAIAGALPESERGKVRVAAYDVAAMPLGPRQTGDLKQEARRRHGVDADAFVVGYSFAMDSNYTRKNPVAAVLAFRHAFPPDGPVPARLVIRCNQAETYPAGLAELQAAIAGDARITLATEAARKPPILDFYHMLDCYLSLHRSEGYGLNLAEAASLGIPVIATGWGLADDIVAMPGIETVAWQLVPVVDPQGSYTGLDARWAEPDIAQAVAALQRLARR